MTNENFTFSLLDVQSRKIGQYIKISHFKNLHHFFLKLLKQPSIIFCYQKIINVKRHNNDISIFMSLCFSNNVHSNKLFSTPNFHRDLDSYFRPYRDFLADRLSIHHPVSEILVVGLHIFPPPVCHLRRLILHQVGTPSIPSVHLLWVAIWLFLILQHDKEFHSNKHHKFVCTL